MTLTSHSFYKFLKNSFLILRFAVILIENNILHLLTFLTTHIYLMLKKFTISAILLIVAFCILPYVLSLDSSNLGSSLLGKTSLNSETQRNILPYKKHHFATEMNTTVKNSGVVILGTSDDLGVFKRPNLINNTYLFGKPHQSLEKTIVDNAATFVLKDINDSMLMEFVPSGDEKFYHSHIYATPNDTIQFEIKNKTLVFTGKNAAENNLSIQLEEHTPKYHELYYRNDLTTYKKEVTSIYEKKVAFFETYRQKHQLAKEFADIYFKKLKYQYYDNLISPRMKKYDSEKIHVNDYDVLPNLIAHQAYNGEQLFDTNSYLENLTVADFQDESAMRNTHFFKNSLIEYVRHYFVKSNATYFSRERLIAEKNFIETNFKGAIKDYAIGRMIWDYYNKGFAYGSENINFMISVIDEYLGSVGHKQSFREKMQDIKDDILTYDFKLSEAALQSKMVNHIGDTITLQDIFNRSKKRVKVVDFWASWCPPCVQQIQESKPFKDRLSVENNVEWIYLSIDTNYEKWLAKSEQLHEYLHFRNSYFLLKERKSALAKELNVYQIPRYVVFDRNNTVMINSAPSPTDEVAFEKIIDNTQVATPIQ